jgi:hypothetical protein
MSAPKASCQNCFFFHPQITYEVFDLRDNVRYGECRRARPAVGKDDWRTTMRQWPVVRYEDWCGEWRHEESGETLL